MLTADTNFSINFHFQVEVDGRRSELVNYICLIFLRYFTTMHRVTRGWWWWIAGIPSDNKISTAERVREKGKNNLIDLEMRKATVRREDKDTRVGRDERTLIFFLLAILDLIFIYCFEQF